MSKNVDEKSDKSVVPVKPPNNEDSSSAEAVEGRPLPEGNRRQTTGVRTQSRVAPSSGLLAVRRAAQTRKDVRFTALL
ncbi:MAG: group II intron reverse transcriptase/maturase, partial [Woeseia sp.]